ncbi:hypothetical protein OJJOAM_003465 [Cupriavidus sp. H18C1]
MVAGSMPMPLQGRPLPLPCHEAAPGPRRRCLVATHHIALLISSSFPMPFGTLFPLPAPRSTPEISTPSWSDAAAQPVGESPALRLDAMPVEILVHVARYLRPSDAFALSQSCHGMTAALDRDILAPLRLAERIRWISGVSAFEAAIRGVLAAPADQRAALFRMLEQRVRHLYPGLDKRAQTLLAPHLALPAWRADAVAVALDGARTAQARQQETAVPALHDWPSLIEACPSQDRASLLATLADNIPDDVGHRDYLVAQNILISALRSAGELDGSLPADHAEALATLATRLALGGPDWTPAAFGEYWDAIWALACRLPLPAQPKVLCALTESVHHDPATRHGHAVELAPRWRRFIDHVGVNFESEDAVGILVGLAEHDCDEPQRDIHVGIIHALLRAAAALPDPCAAQLLAAIVRCRPNDEPIVATLWDTTFAASEPVAGAHAAPPYEELAWAIEDLPVPIQNARWDALCQRIGTLPKGEVAVGALRILARFEPARRSPARRAALAGIAASLEPARRAELWIAMMVSRGITAPIWHAMVMELCELPLHVRLEPARRLGDMLFHFAAGDGVFAPDHGPADAGRVLAATMPRTPSDALARLSDILALLPLGHRSAVLLDFTLTTRRPGGAQPLPGPWHLGRALWLLQEAMRLGPLHRHAIGIVTNVAMLATRYCAAEQEARSIVPPLQRAVLALPAEARATAFYCVITLITRANYDVARKRAWAGHVAALPPMDRPDGAPVSRKRKDLPA